MFVLPDQVACIIRVFAPAFSERVWDWVQVLIIGAILAPGKRTVTAVLRVMGLSQEQQYQNYHRVLNRAKWSGLVLSRILLGLLVTTFVASGAPVVLGVDETLERRRGEKIRAKGTFRDAVRSSKKYTVYSWGLRWVSMMILVSVPWSSHTWALPFLTVLAPSPKTNAANNRRHKTSIDWVGQMVKTVRRWLPTRALVVVVDGGLAAIKLGWQCALCQPAATLVSRLRLDAQLHDFLASQPKSKRGRKPKKGKRQPSLAKRVADEQTPWEEIEIDWYGRTRRKIEIISDIALWYTSNQTPLPLRWVLVRDPLNKFDPQAFFATDLMASPAQILAWVILRWGVEVTFEQARAHLGVETQRQWSDLAIERTTPALFGLFSVIVLVAHQLSLETPLPVRSAAWYAKSEATFSDVLASVRQFLWTNLKFNNSPAQTRLVPIPAFVLDGLMEAVCYTT